jgi:crotonobetainyl-CoA:carnitine CoA-transferase CaiB-like acyl-CoA transferase
VTKPFANVRIIDFTRVLAGPFASYQLALMGADVIKIEAHGGDDMRYGGADKAWSARGMAPGWLAVNANKRSLTLDLKKPEGIAIAKRLAESADVVIENFRPGVMDGLGIGYEALSAINPRLIYCAVSGFGQTGPERGAAAFDGMIQAMSGLMSITGHAETGPTRAGFPACDVTAGATAAFGVASALYQRTHTGRGQLVDVAMLDAMLAFLGGQVAEWTVTGKRPPQAGNLSVTRKPTGDMFPTADGYIVLAVMTDRQFESLMRAIGRPEAAADPRFADWDKRIANAGALRAIIVEALASADAKTWAERLRAADAPCGKVYSIDEILAHPQLEHRDVIQRIDTAHGTLTLAGSGVRLGHDGPGIDRPPPALGEHTAEILASVGYGADEIERLRAQRVI